MTTPKLPASGWHDDLAGIRLDAAAILPAREDVHNRKDVHIGLSTLCAFPYGN
jgi:hypothetical protein